MKPFLFILLLATSSIGSLNAQSLSGKSAAFAALFEEVQANNFHLYAHFGDNLPADYAYTGRKIGKKFTGLFTGEYRNMLEEGKDLYAVARIKNEGAEVYIIRLPSNKGPHTFYLFEWQGEALHPVQLLAYAFCADGNCYQQDCWVADLNGDSNADLLTRFRRTLPGSGQVLADNEQVYLQKDAGRFGIVPQGAVKVEQGRFEMEELAY